MNFIRRFQKKTRYGKTTKMFFEAYKRVLKGEKVHFLCHSHEYANEKGKKLRAMVKAAGGDPSLLTWSASRVFDPGLPPEVQLLIDPKVKKVMILGDEHEYRPRAFLRVWNLWREKCRREFEPSSKKQTEPPLPPRSHEWRTEQETE